MIAQLPDRYREGLTLFYMEEKSYEEVPRLLDLPMGTVKTHLHRAKKLLATAVRDSRTIVRECHGPAAHHKKRKTHPSLKRGTASMQPRASARGPFP